MGKIAPAVPPPPQRYRDDVDAVSLHTTREDYEYDDVPELPSYSDSEAAAAAAAESASRRDQQETHLEPSARSTVQAVTRGEQTIVMDERLNDPDALHAYIESFVAREPPHQSIRVHGWHNNTVHRDNKKETERVVDFDIKLSLQEYLPSGGVLETGWQPALAANKDRVYRGSWRKTMGEAHAEDLERYAYECDLAQWCQLFCASQAKLKVFRVKRDVTGFDTDYLRQNLEALIRSTNYRGHIQITFPIEGRFVDIYNPHIINRWRTNWVRWLFYVSMLWIITWPILFFMTKRWTVYSVNWRFSWINQTRKHYAKISEVHWCNKYGDLVKRLAVDRFQGDATHLPLADQREPRAMPSTGNVDIDSAVNLLHGGVQAWNTLQRGLGRDVDGWGANS